MGRSSDVHAHGLFALWQLIIHAMRPSQLRMLVSVCFSVCMLLFTAIARSEVVCQDSFKYVLGTQLETDGYWLSFTDQSTLPINHNGGDRILTLSVARLNAQWLQVNVAMITTTAFWTWKVEVQMDKAEPVRFSKTFRPEPNMPLFALSLDPVCTGT